jgi:tRNA threonylcarbamoyl adenosine modification protein (Sua5/YciO/YrdC/YwlC family)
MTAMSDPAGRDGLSNLAAVAGLALMSARYDCSDPAQRVVGIDEAASALRKGDLVVLPTDTVYGVAADAFSPVAVTCLLAAKGRGRQAPPPVLVGSVRAALALVEDVSAAGKDLIDEFWPGGLTLVFRANPTLAWDLGDTMGTVAVRMPLHPITLEVLRETGPLAVSSANRTGLPPATTAAQAEEQLGETVAVYLDGGPCPGDSASTIVDLTGPVPRLLRRGVISSDRLRRVVALIGDDDDEPPVLDVPSWAADVAASEAAGATGSGAADDSAADDSASENGASENGASEGSGTENGGTEDGAAVNGRPVDSAEGTPPEGTHPGGEDMTGGGAERA